MYQHYLPGSSHGTPSLGTGLQNTFRNDGKPENDNFALLGMANQYSSYTCTCGREGRF